jgi:cation transport regulator ChaC
VPQEDGHVDGVIYKDVPDSAWERLDRFEGEMYDRQTVKVKLKDGTTMPAATYVVKPEFMGYIDPSDWDFEEFRRNRKASFQRQYKGYLSL